MQARIDDYETQVRALQTDIENSRSHSNSKSVESDQETAKSPPNKKLKPKAKAGSSEMIPSMPLRSSARSKVKP